MKRILAIVLMGCLAAAPLSVSAETIVETGEAYEESEVKTSIEEFFYSYENMDASAEINEIMEEVINASSLEEVQKYEMDHAAGLERAAGQSANNATYLEMVELLLQRRDIIEKTAAEDYYKVILKKESGEWKISNISGLADAIMDESLAELEDEITCGEREGYIEAIAEEYSFDLETSDILEENADKSAELYTSPLNAAVTRATSGYNNTAAISYALKYAITPNSAYADFTGSGGDCTNFISQCLYAGGIKQHTGTAYSGTCWFYKTSTNRSNVSLAQYYGSSSKVYYHINGSK